jgi:hypothetical protein
METNKLIQALHAQQPFSVRYFVLKNNKLPNVVVLNSKFDVIELANHITSNFPEAILNPTKRIDYFLTNTKEWNAYNGKLFSIIKENFFIEYEDDNVYMCFDENIDKEEINSIKNKLRLLSIDHYKEANKFSMIKKNDYGDFELANFKTRKVEVDINDNYNDDLVDLTPDIINFINDKNRNGIVLFHGIPGSGKTTYLRYLIANTEAKFIYLPNNLFSNISDPHFISFISSYPNSIIVLEDCEELIKSRDQQNDTSGITNMLNLGDGLLGDALQLKLICTFNCDLSKIDAAIMRKGRLVYRYEFDKLELDKTNRLFTKLGIEYASKEKMTLTDIFNFKHDNKIQKTSTKSIGFAKKTVIN